MGIPVYTTVDDSPSHSHGYHPYAPPSTDGTRSRWRDYRAARLRQLASVSGVTDLPHSHSSIQPSSSIHSRSQFREAGRTHRSLLSMALNRASPDEVAADTAAASARLPSSSSSSPWAALLRTSERSRNSDADPAPAPSTNRESNSGDQEREDLALSRTLRRRRGYTFLRPSILDQGPQTDDDDTFAAAATTATGTRPVPPPRFESLFSPRRVLNDPTLSMFDPEYCPPWLQNRLLGPESNNRESAGATSSSSADTSRSPFHSIPPSSAGSSRLAGMRRRLAEMLGEDDDLDVASLSRRLPRYSAASDESNLAILDDSLNNFRRRRYLERTTQPSAPEEVQFGTLRDDGSLPETRNESSASNTLRLSSSFTIPMTIPSFPPTTSGAAAEAASSSITQTEGSVSQNSMGTHEREDSILTTLRRLREIRQNVLSISDQMSQDFIESWPRPSNRESSSSRPFPTFPSLELDDVDIWWGTGEGPPTGGVPMSRNVTTRSVVNRAGDNTSTATDGSSSATLVSTFSSNTRSEVEQLGEAQQQNPRPILAISVVADTVPAVIPSAPAITLADLAESEITQTISPIEALPPPVNSGSALWASLSEAASQALTSLTPTPSTPIRPHLPPPPPPPPTSQPSTEASISASTVVSPPTTTAVTSPALTRPPRRSHLYSPGFGPIRSHSQQHHLASPRSPSVSPRLLPLPMTSPRGYSIVPVVVAGAEGAEAGGRTRSRTLSSGGGTPAAVTMTVDTGARQDGGEVSDRFVMTQVQLDALPMLPPPARNV